MLTALAALWVPFPPLFVLPILCQRVEGAEDRSAGVWWEHGAMPSVNSFGVTRCFSMLKWGPWPSRGEAAWLSVAAVLWLTLGEGAALGS